VVGGKTIVNMYTPMGNARMERCWSHNSSFDTLHACTVTMGAHGYADYAMDSEDTRAAVF
jgi:hypothetical protein